MDGCRFLLEELGYGVEVRVTDALVPIILKMLQDMNGWRRQVIMTRYYGNREEKLTFEETALVLDETVAVVEETCRDALSILQDRINKAPIVVALLERQNHNVVIQ